MSGRSVGVMGQGWVAVVATDRDIAPPMQAAGHRLWSSVTDEYDLDEHERAVLVEACRTADALTLLDDVVRAEGPLLAGPQGVRAHPALVEARQQRVVLARLLAALRLPAGSEGDVPASARPPRRAGAKGVYLIRGVRS